MSVTGDQFNEFVGEAYQRSREDVVKWLRAGCPGMDREVAVAFGPITVPGSIADAIEAGVVEDFIKHLRNPEST